MDEKWVLLASGEIDKTKWDQCVDTHANGLIYASTNCLDTLAENWHGIVIDEYSAVIPLPWKKKWGIRYLYTPSFLQQLGIIGRYKASFLPVILQAVNHFCRYGDLHFNYANQLAASLLRAEQKTNLVIPLAPDAGSVREKYKQDTKDNIRKAEAHSLLYTAGNTSNSIRFFQQQYAQRIPHIGRDAYLRFEQLCNTFEQTGNCITRDIMGSTGTVLATAVLLKDTKRLYNLMNTTLPEGRKAGANHLLIDSIIGEFSGSGLLLDLEGSELPGVQQFYLSFGAIGQPYFHYHLNRLPWPLNRLKR